MEESEMKHVKRLIIPILLLALASASPLWSGETGKIAGIVTDKTTGEPLPGANIVVVGTMLGASADQKGQYTILYVPPGTYEVQASLLGYGKVTVREIRVYIDQTARIDVALDPQAVEVGEITVIAQRPVIKTDVATSVIEISDRDMEKLPVNSVVSAIGLQAGVRGGWNSGPGGAAQPTYVSNYTRGNVSVQGGLSIRGGGGDNILFQVDGITMRDPRNSEPTTQVPLSAVEEVAVERGGFDAEYGQVRSGIINVVTKEGSKHEYNASVQMRYSPPSPKYWRGPGVYDIQDPNSYVMRPFFDPAVCWTGTTNGAWDKYTRTKYPIFAGWNEISRLLNSDNDPTNDLTPAGAQRAFEYETRKKQPNEQADYDIDAGFGGPVPYVGEMLGNLRFFTSYRGSREMLVFPMTRPDYKEFNWTARLSSDITPSMKLRLYGMVGKQYTIRANWDNTGAYFYPRSPADIAGVAGSITHVYDLVGMFADYNFCLADIGLQSYAAKLTHSFSPSTYYEVYLEHFRRDYDVRPSALRDTSIHYEVLPGYFEDSNPFGYWPYDSKGVIITGGAHVAKARDFSAVNSTTLKADFASQVDFENLVKGGLEFNYNDLNLDYGLIASATSGKTYDVRVQMRNFPIRGSAYLQDKLETKGFTLKAGLRLDYSNSNTDWWDVGSYDAAFFSSLFQDTSAFAKQKSESQWQLSPRIGIAFPITENSKLFFNYGHFKQVPQYESLFRVQRYSQGSMASFGNPSLTLAKTISYELGFDQVVFEDVLLQAAAYYNDVSNQQDFTTYFSTINGYNYTKSTSNNYEDVRGLELTIRKATGRWWAGFINYTYQVNTTGHFGSAQVYDNLAEQKKYDAATVNRYQNRPIPQPYARANLNLFTPEDFGPSVAGHHLLGGFGLNLIANWQAGYWTTWNPQNLPYVAYNVQALDFFDMNLRLDKLININNFRIQFFIDVSNLLNTRRLWNTGDQFYMHSLHLPKSDAYPNIPGDDKVGDYRTPGVDWQPMVYQAQVQGTIPPTDYRAIFYEGLTSRYWQVVKNPQSGANSWAEVDQARIDKINEDKAYIDMPNQSTYWFLDPRKIYFGLRVSVSL
jgi:outer membrane receptor protein involved in Fe transport